jgi:hypothetical protein
MIGQTIEGLTEGSYGALSPAEFKLRRMRPCPIVGPATYSVEFLVSFWRTHIETADWFREERECMCVFLVDFGGNVLGYDLVGMGAGDAVWVQHSAVFRCAIHHGSARVVVVHNHPSGSALPSENDVAFTRRLYLAGSMIGIELLDSLVVADQGNAIPHASLKRIGYFDRVEKADEEMEAQKLKRVHLSDADGESHRDLSSAVFRAAGLLETFAARITFPDGDDQAGVVELRASAQQAAMSVRDCFALAMAEWQTLVAHRATTMANA